MDDRGREEEEEEGEGEENLRELILEQLANLEQSDASDEGSYKVRLSCILEDDESESSGGCQKDGVKKSEKESEKGLPEEVRKPSRDRETGGRHDSETTDGVEPSSTLQITDLDDETLVNVTQEEENGGGTEESDDFDKLEGFPISKLKSSDDVRRKPFVVRRREPSSDSSDFDVSMTNSGSSELKIVEITEADDDKTLDATPEMAAIESETSFVDDEPEPKSGNEKRNVDVLNSETLSELFAKVSKTYLEKTKGHVKWEENERIDANFAAAAEERRSRSRSRECDRSRTLAADHLHLQDIHIRGTSPRQYDPPVPPETYLWEELKRLRERGGYPWTYLDKPAFDEATWKKYMEHVYEPINPPQPSRMADGNVSSREEFAVSPNDFGIPQKVPAKKESKVSEEAKSREESTESEKDKKVQEIISAVEKEGRNEEGDRVPEDIPSTSGPGKTGIGEDVSHCQGFEDLPVRKSALGQTRRQKLRAQARDVRQKWRNHMGRIKTRFNAMPGTSSKEKDTSGGESPKFRLPEIHAPKISLPDRSKFKLPEGAIFHLPESAKSLLPDKSKFHLPERPKFNLAEKIHLPDKTKFQLSEGSKFHLPDRAKFHLPDKAKFQLPEGAKFHLPDRAKFHLPDKAKFQLPEGAKFHLPDRAKFHLPDRAKFHLPEGAKLHFPEMPKFHFPQKKKLYRPKLEAVRIKKKRTSETPSISSPIKLNFKSHQKSSGKRLTEYVTSSPKETRGRTPPPRMMAVDTRPENVAEKWMENLEGLQYADDEDADEEVKETDFRKTEPLLAGKKSRGNEEDHGAEPENVGIPAAASHLPRPAWETPNGRKKGVLEEIDSDEYFLRQKGISQDDIDVGRYLSHEIREAFRSPGGNALAKMDYPDDENERPQSRTEPEKPTRTSAVKTRSILKKTSASDPSMAEDGYKTYPPSRPGRKSKSQSKSLLDEEITDSRPQTSSAHDSRYGNDETNSSRYDRADSDEDDVSEYYKSPKSAKEYEHYKVPRCHVPVPPSPSPPRKSYMEGEISRKGHEIWNGEEIASEPPVPMARKKSKKKQKKKMLLDEIGATREREPSPQKFDLQPEEVVLGENASESPVPPKRSKPSRSGWVATEDEIDGSFRSEAGSGRPDDESLFEKGNSIEETSFSEMESVDFPPTNAEKVQITDLDDVGFGYATVGKPTVVKPQRRNKKKKAPERPPPPARKVSLPVFYEAYFRKVPVRPLRNYSSLGPSRPPRRSKSGPLPKENSVEELVAKISPEPSDSVDVFGSGKDLKADKVIEKMKGRPLPPPPRPPRQKSKGPDDPSECGQEQGSPPQRGENDFALESHVTAAFVPTSDKEIVRGTSATEATPEDFPFEGEDTSEAIRELDHEQLRMHQEFLEEMKREEEESRRKGVADDGDAELRAEVIRQIEDAIEDERRVLEEREGRRKPDDPRSKRQSVDGAEERKEEEKPEVSHLDVEADMGYASLERRGHRREPNPPNPVPAKPEYLRVGELEADAITVREVQAERIFVKELQSNRIASQDIDNTGGNVVLGEVNFSPDLMDQIVAKIPWRSLREAQDGFRTRESSQRQSRPSPSRDESEEERGLIQPERPHRKPRRKCRRHSSGDEKEVEGKTRLHDENSENATELGLRLARVCICTGVRVVESFVRSNARLVRSVDRETFVQIILSIAIALVAAYFLFGFDANTTHFHRWDFHNFPPQPPDSML